MKKWYYTVKLGSRELSNMDGIEDGIDVVVQRAVSHILYEFPLISNTRCVINLFDYPPPFGQAIHMFEFNIIR